MSVCTLCGEPMPPGEEMFKYHGYSCECPKPPLPKPPSYTITIPRAQHEALMAVAVALSKIIPAIVNSGDDSLYESGELPETDEATAALAALEAAGIQTEGDKG